MRVAPRGQFESSAMRLEVCCRGVPFPNIDVNIDCFKQGFMCYKLYLHACNLEIEPAVEPLIPVNASIEERRDHKS